MWAYNYQNDAHFLLILAQFANIVETRLKYNYDLVFIVSLKNDIKIHWYTGFGGSMSFSFAVKTVTLQVPTTKMLYPTLMPSSHMK